MNDLLRSRPKIAIALGDPAGIGAEVVLKALNQNAIAQRAEITLVGNQAILQRTVDHLAASNQIALADPNEFELIDIPIEPASQEQICWGVGNAASGSVSFQSLEVAIAHTLAGEFQAIVTAPIAKSAWAAAGHFYPGQTELLAEKAGTDRVGMLFVARSPYTQWVLRTLLATTHIPLRQVADVLCPDLMTLKLSVLVDALQTDFGISHPRVAIAGLNPHSGEQGQLGHEELEWLHPWIASMGDRFPTVQLDGAIPPDTLWVRPGQAWYGTARSPQAHDAYLALYHDQGLIPVKLMAFDRAVNTTLGLPFIRTSPDHGTAFDIAGQGRADSTSMEAAIELAIELALQKLAALPANDDAKL